jgi:hypothetical protein
MEPPQLFLFHGVDLVAAPRPAFVRGSAPPVFGVEMRQYALAHQLDDPHHLGGLHAGPAEAENR